MTMRCPYDGLYLSAGKPCRKCGTRIVRRGPINAQGAPGGRARALALSDERRREIASKAAQARWSKR